jgi:bifunctional enzyme CysN/CysC
MICLTAFISPYRSDRDRARAASPDAFHEVYIRADLETCEQRDPKGLYKKARRGEIAEFTGVSAPYEAPASPELVLDTERHSIEECVRQALDYVERHFAIRQNGGRSGR